MSYTYDTEVSSYLTWDEATRSWNSAIYTWNNPGSGIKYDNEVGFTWEYWDTAWEDEVRTWDELTFVATQNYDSEASIFVGGAIPDAVIGSSFIIRGDSENYYTYDSET